MNLNKKIKTLKGEEIELTVGEVVASTLANEKQDDPMRAYLLATEIMKGDKKFNDADITFMKEALKKSTGYTPLAVGQTLLELEN